MPEIDRQRLELQVVIFNTAFPIGTKVRRYALLSPLREPDAEDTTTTSRAWVLSGHSPVIMLAGTRGCVHLDSVVPEGIVFPDLPKPKKLTRAQQVYQDFLDADFGMKFIEYLRWRGRYQKRLEGGA